MDYKDTHSYSLTSNRSNIFPFPQPQRPEAPFHAGKQTEDAGGNGQNVSVTLGGTIPQHVEEEEWEHGRVKSEQCPYNNGIPRMITY